MNSNLLFDFSVDKENKTITVKREFAAELPMVWDAWTKPELLDQWWAPKPFRAQTKAMDFREGGYWLYVMIGPKNEEFWSRADYHTIRDQKSFSALDGFCDENGTINPDFPRSNWTNSFSENAGTTIVNVVIKYDKLADLEKIIEMGFKEGFTAGLNNLEQLLEARVKK